MADLSRPALNLERIRKFVVVAEELHFGRAAERLLIAGPSLSQQIKALERDLGVLLFERDRRSVTLTPAGAELLPHTKALLDRADDLKRRAGRLAGSEQVRIGYVNWRPADLRARAAGVADLIVDTWVVPSHAQAARVADGSLDLGICWIRDEDLGRLELRARLLGADRLHAVSVGDDDRPVRAADVLVLVDDDENSWSSWNVYAEMFAHDTGATVVRISDGGITGEAFVDHVRRTRRPVLNSPKGQEVLMPPDVVRRPIVEPTPLWTWSLVWRRDEVRRAVLETVEAVARDVVCELNGWLPYGDPYRVSPPRT
ncbi:LysR family transcriptional regulator [Kutzneria buriramensis]|uniref:DNA-binding transcriptional LysR family regulator n=1 Tax=Kutzneria buriramensis TaxID=1045776 RepID=A0A3E0HFA6_9PSEU|nr:LysR family transcriptional regulator [Kutzneria buriramensis]REH43878.1 DNA-binding transcriptional LysR family regulator [Kutzneria buriramensis]